MRERDPPSSGKLSVEPKRNTAACVRLRTRSNPHASEAGAPFATRVQRMRAVAWPDGERGVAACEERLKKAAQMRRRHARALGAKTIGTRLYDN